MDDRPRRPPEILIVHLEDGEGWLTTLTDRGAVIIAASQRHRYPVAAMMRVADLLANGHTVQHPGMLERLVVAVCEASMAPVVAPPLGEMVSLLDLPDDEEDDEREYRCSVN